MEIFSSLLLFKLFFEPQGFTFLIADKFKDEYAELFDLLDINVRNMAYMSVQYENTVLAEVVAPQIPLNGMPYDERTNPLPKLFSLLLRNAFEKRQRGGGGGGGGSGTVPPILYISRKKQSSQNVGAMRYIQNQEEVNAVFAATPGCQLAYFEGLSFAEKFALLRGRKKIFVEFGAGITNLFFAQLEPGCDIVFFIPRTFYTKHPLFQTDLECIAGLCEKYHYAFWVCENMDCELLRTGDGVNAPYMVDVARIQKEIEAQKE